MNTTVDLLDCLRAHLTAFKLPAIASVHMTPSLPHAPEVTVQLARHDSLAVADALLAWADTLTTVTAEAWRVPGGYDVHLSVSGQLPGGASIRVFGGVAFSPCGIGADLAPNASKTVPLAMLRERATPGQVML
jgi:hypothetical protein